MKHAKLFPPSSALRVMTCPGSAKLSIGIPSRLNEASARGTVAHAISESMLVDGHDITAFGEVWHVNADGLCDDKDAEFIVRVDDAMREIVTSYVTSARKYISQVGDNDWIVEDKLSIEHLTGEEGARGTADLVVLNRRELQIHDLKTGFHEVSPEANPQLMIYALAALEKYGAVQDFDTVLLVIHQPTVGGPREWRIGVRELRSFGFDVAKSAEIMREALQASDVTPYLQPTTDGCRFCPARATCPALRKVVDDVTAADFADMDTDTLGDAMGKVELVESWCKEVRAEAERRLLAGTPVSGFKLVQGRRGARKWSNSDVAETLLVQAVGDAAYDKKLISPASAEKVLKKNPVWATVAEHITQEEGKPSVAPLSDKRDEWSPASADDFETLA